MVPEDTPRRNDVHWKKFLTVLKAFLLLCILLPKLQVAAAQPLPANLFNIGNSIGEAEAAYDEIGVSNHETAWSTGYDRNDIVYSLNERFEDQEPTTNNQNNADRDALFNRAVSGSEMGNFAEQAEEVVSASQTLPSKKVGMIAIFLGANDVCADSLDAMTPPKQFEAHFRAGLDVLSAASATRNAHIHISGIPAIYWLWEAKQSNSRCRLAWYFVPCRNLLDNPSNDCGSDDSHLDPDTIHPDDGPNCIRRKMFHAKIRDIYNPILKQVAREYKTNGRLPNAYYVDLFEVRFMDIHINNGDCFHPSVAGQSLLAEQQWCRSPWGRYDPKCPHQPILPGIPLLLLDE
jgi:lysophospholipase L1-like esterase